MKQRRVSNRVLQRAESVESIEVCYNVVQRRGWHAEGRWTMGYRERKGCSRREFSTGCRR